MQGTRAGTDCSPVQAEMTFPTDSESLLRPRQCPQGSFASGEPEALKPRDSPKASVYSLYCKSVHMT